MAWPTSGVLDIVARMYVPGLGWVDIDADIRRGGDDNPRGITITEATTGFNQPGWFPSRAEFEINNRDGKYSRRNPNSPYAFAIGLNTKLYIPVEGEFQFYGEVSSDFPTVWTTGGHDAWVPLVAEGRSRRMNNDTDALDDPLCVAMEASTPLWSWCATDTSSPSFLAPGPGTAQPVNLERSGAGSVELATVAGPVGSSRLPDYTNKGSFVATLQHHSVTEYAIEIWFQIKTGDIDPAAVFVPIQIDFRDSTFPAADLSVSAISTGRATLDFTPYAITTTFQQPPSFSTRSAVLNAVATGAPCDQGVWHMARLLIFQLAPGTTEFGLELDDTQIADDSNSADTYTWGSISRITINPVTSWLGTDAYYGADGDGLLSIGAVAIYGSSTRTDSYQAGTGYIGETAGRRLQRLFEQAGIGFRWRGDLDETTPMGPQRAGLSLAQNAAECQGADGGYLHDDREQLGLFYRTRTSIYNQPPTVDVAYDSSSDGLLALQHDENEAFIANKITGQSVIAGTVVDEKASGDRNTNEPEDDPKGVGTQPETFSYNVETPADLADAVGWGLRVGTLDAPRFPSAELNIRKMAVLSGLRPVYDRFGRSVTAGAGTADSGQSWTVGATAADHDVADGVYTQEVTSANVFRTAVIPTGSVDWDITVDVALNVGNTGGASVTQWICGRANTGLTDYYTARLDANTAGTVTLTVFVRSGGVLSSALGGGGVVVGAAHQSGEVWRVHFRGAGATATITASAFRVGPTTGEGDTEPASPVIGPFTDATLAALATGTNNALLTRRESGNTDAGLVASWMNFFSRPAWQRAATAWPGDLFHVTNTPIWIPDDVDQLIGGRTIRVANLEYDATFNLTQATSWLGVGGPLEDDDHGRPDSEDSYLHGARDASSTSFQVRNIGVEGTPTLWGYDSNFLTRVGGEDVSVTAISTVTPAFVAAGTVAHADNASVTPGLPGSGAARQLLVLFAVARTTTTSVDTAALEAAGWTCTKPWPHFLIATKLHSGSESAPTVTFTGGAAGDTHSAVITSWTGVQQRIVDYSQADNSSAQNIAVNSLTSRRDNVLAIRFGWKQDDWTSVAALTGATEAVDASSALGNDQGIAVDYSLDGARKLYAADSFVVTGGASAISRSVIMLLDCNVQAWTVTRAANGSTAVSHSDGEQVRLTNPMILAW